MVKRTSFRCDPAQSPYVVFPVPDVKKPVRFVRFNQFPKIISFAAIA